MVKKHTHPKSVVSAWRRPTQRLAHEDHNRPSGFRDLCPSIEQEADLLIASDERRERRALRQQVRVENTPRC